MKSNIRFSQSPNDPTSQHPNLPSVVFFGSSSYVLPIIETLQENFDLALVITTEKPEGTVPSYCQQNKIEFLSVSSLSDSKLELKIKNLKLKIAVLADFGLIVPQSLLNVFPMGIINIHPSLLPKYRGPTPVQTAILNGEKTAGVSIIKLDEEIDHGPILRQKKEEILGTDTSESLYKRLFAKSANLLPKVLDLYFKDKLKPTTQNHKEATFTKPLSRNDGYIDISNLKTIVTRIDTMIRAYFPWPGVWFKMKLNDKEKIIKLLPNPLTAQQPNNPILIQVEGKKPVNYKDFINGYPQAKGVISQVFEDGITGKNMP